MIQKSTVLYRIRANAGNAGWPDHWVSLRESLTFARNFVQVDEIYKDRLMFQRKVRESYKQVRA